jgi:hypothetical protein
MLATGTMQFWTRRPVVPTMDWERGLLTPRS